MINEPGRVLFSTYGKYAETVMDIRFCASVFKKTISEAHFAGLGWLPDSESATLLGISISMLYVRLLRRPDIPINGVWAGCALLCLSVKWL
jgi:hypothetical protein